MKTIPMDTATAHILRTLTNDFYRRHSASFSVTRKAPWLGWHRCLDLLTGDSAFDTQQFSTFDMACGNLRFESFLASHLPGADLTFYAADDCRALLPDRPPVRFQDVDILTLLLENRPLAGQFEAPPCDLSVAFGFLHHVPTQRLRGQILRALAAQTRPGGYVIVSLWQFLNNPQLAAKAQVTHQEALARLGLAPLDDGDYLLGWNNEPDTYRYCHHFSEEEVDQLCQSLAAEARCCARFSADGRGGRLNTYLAWQVR